MPGHIGVGVHGSGGDSWSVQLVQGPRPSGGGPGVNVPAASIHPVTCGSGSGSPQEPQLVVRTRVTGEQSSVRHSETVATAGEQHTSPAPGPGPGEEGSVPHEGHGSGSDGMRLSGTSAHLLLVEEVFSDAG